jgi:hypothetical protein
MARNTLISIYLDWRNNYLTYEKFAEHNEITEAEAVALIGLARSVFDSKNPNE